MSEKNNNNINCKKLNLKIEPRCGDYKNCKWIKNVGCINMEQEWNAYWNEEKNSWYYQKVEHNNTKIKTWKKPYNTSEILKGTKGMKAYWRNNKNEWLYEKSDTNLNKNETLIKEKINKEKSENIEEDESKLEWLVFWNSIKNQWYYQKIGETKSQWKKPNNTPEIDIGNKNWRAIWSKKNNGRWMYANMNDGKIYWSINNLDKINNDKKNDTIQDESKLEWLVFWDSIKNQWYYQKIGETKSQWKKPNNTPEIEIGNKNWRAIWSKKNNGRWMYANMNDGKIYWNISKGNDTLQIEKKNENEKKVEKDTISNYIYKNANVEQTTVSNSISNKTASQNKLPASINKRNVELRKINKIIDKIKNKDINTIVGPYEIFKFKFNNRNIIFAGEMHHNLPKLKENEIYLLDLFKLQLLRDNEQCYDLLVELTPKHLSIFNDSSLINYGGNIDTNNIFNIKNKNNSESSLTNWFYDDDLIKCSSHYINPNHKRLKEYKGQCPFENLRYHNIDLRFLNYNIKEKYEILHKKNQNQKNYLKLIDLLVNKDNKYNVNDLIDEFKKIRIDNNDAAIKEYANTIWNLIRKEESKIDKKYIPDLDKFKKIFLDKNKKLSEKFSRNIVGFMDYYAILRLFIKYDENKLNRTDKKANYGVTPYKCKNINSNENILYYCGADHIILCYEILNGLLNKEPVLKLNYFKMKERKKLENIGKIDNKISLEHFETFNKNIEDLFGIFEL